MTTALDRLREDFAAAERELRAVWNWSEADVTEMVAGIQTAKASQDAGLLECWATWLAQFAEDYRRRAALARIVT